MIKNSPYKYFVWPSTSFEHLLSFVLASMFPHRRSRFPHGTSFIPFIFKSRMDFPELIY